VVCVTINLDYIVWSSTIHMVCLMINSGYTVVNGTVISEYSCVKNMEGSEVLFQYFARETDEGRP
jgi:hypothetical protein